MKPKKNLHRRNFIELTVAGSLAWLTQSCRNSEITQVTTDSTMTLRQTPRIRYDIASTNEAAKRNVENLSKVVGFMKTLPESNYCSWIAQAKIHKDHCPHLSPIFLPWHRAYLFYFEEICRKLLKENLDIKDSDDFALPYWDWSSSPQMPEVFWKDSLQNDTRPPQGWVKDPFDYKRQNAENAQADPDRVGTDRIGNILKKRFYGVIFGNGTGQMESGPHGYIHNEFIRGNMGKAETAALDPIFWLHHANIDRLWSIWMKMHADATPSPNCQVECIDNNPPRIRDWLLCPVKEFYDADGNLVKPRVCSLLNTFDPNVFNGGYHYYNDSDPIDFGECTVMTKTNSPGYWIKGEVGNDKIAPINESITIKISNYTSVPQTLSSSLNALVTKDKLNSAQSPALLLTIEVEKPANPQISVRVFINAPQDPSNNFPVSSPAYVSTFTFFESSETTHRHNNEDKNGESRKFTFDVTDTILELSKSKLFTLEEATISLSPEPLSDMKLNNKGVRLISFEFDLVN